MNREEFARVLDLVATSIVRLDVHGAGALSPTQRAELSALQLPRDAPPPHKHPGEAGLLGRFGANITHADVHAKVKPSAEAEQAAQNGRFGVPLPVAPLETKRPQFTSEGEIGDVGDVEDAVGG